MKKLQWLVVAALAAAPDREGAAATVAVKITGLPQTAYELNVSGIRKSGRMSAQPGSSTVRDSVDVGALRQVTAALVFSGSSGVIARCPEVHVPVAGAAPSCEPAFVLTDRRSGTEGYLCESRCERSRAAETSEPAPSGDEEEWIYASRRRGPLVDGWTETASFKSFYTGVMSDAPHARVYSSSAGGL